MAESWPDSEPVVRLVAGRWTLAVPGELAKGGGRYQDLHTALGRISYKVLTDTLRRAERDGLISRHLDSQRVETATLYMLTDVGRSLTEPLAALGRWADANWQSVEAAHREWDIRS
jgi:DNA-binding HxlR family transcriptional regulator